MTVADHCHAFIEALLLAMSVKHAWANDPQGRESEALGQPRRRKGARSSQRHLKS